MYNYNKHRSLKMDKKEIIKKINLKVEKFENFRKENNLSKKTFCDLCRISISTYNKILSKEHDFNLMSLFRILRVTNLHCTDVF